MRITTKEFLNNLNNYIIIINKDYEIKFCNKAILDRIGYSLDEIKGCHIYDIIKNKDFNCSELQNETESKSIYRFKTKAVSPLNGTIYLTVMESDNSKYFSLLIKEKIYVEIENNKIENQQKIKSACKLQQTNNDEDDLQLFLDIAADLIGIIDLQGNFIKLNDRWTELLGWTREELLEKRWYGIVVEEDLEFTNDILNQVVENKNESVINAVNRYRCKNGDVKCLQWVVKYLKDKKQIIGIARDVTEIFKLDEKKMQYEKALQLEKIKGEFFANISHEFKTPINIILSAMQLINNHIECGNIKSNNIIDLDKYMKSIKQNSYRLLKISNNLIDMTKIDTGYYKIQLENHNIVSIVEDITMSVVQYIENKGLDLIFDTEIEEEIIACDPDKIERIMLNLLSNAVKYTKANGKIEVNIKSDSHWVTISVIDDGIGMPRELKDSVFNRFMQVDTSLARRCEGSGIGLSLVKSLVEMHNGDISVESNLEEGSKFSFKLPVRKSEDITKCNIIEDINNYKVEKCRIEFSDIYDL